MSWCDSLLADVDPILRSRQDVGDKLSLCLRLNQKDPVNKVLSLHRTYALTTIHAPYHTPFITVSYFNRGPHLPENRSSRAVEPQSQRNAQEL